MRALEESVEDRRRHRLGERIHRSNLVGMGILPLQFLPGESADSLGPTGRETLHFDGISQAIASAFAAGPEVSIRAVAEDGGTSAFRALVRIDTPQELLYYRHGATCSSCCANSWGAGACSGDATPPRSRSRQAGARGLGPGGGRLHRVLPRQRPASVLIRDSSSAVGASP